MTTKTILAFSFVFAATTSAMAKLDAQACINKYASFSVAKKLVGKPMQMGGSALVLGMTTAGSLGVVGGGVSTIGVLGGSTLGKIGDEKVAEAVFASNLAQSLLEISAGVLGPYTSQLVADLNGAIYDTGSFVPKMENEHLEFSSPLNDDLKIELKTSLNGQEIPSGKLIQATKAMLDSGSLCPITGGVLTQEEWARLIVYYVVESSK